VTRHWGIDIDGVLADFISTYRWVVRFGPEPLTEEQRQLLRQDPTDWYSHVRVVGPVNDDWFWAEGIYRHRPFAVASPINNELEYLQALPGEKFLITSRPRGTEDQTYEWLGLHRVKVQGVFHVSKPAEKLEFVNCLDLDVFVDDHPETIPGMRGKTAAELVLRDQPWNQHAPVPRRIQSLKELL
jgi:uncharacterized HAD superfamily protein